MSRAPLVTLVVLALCVGATGCELFLDFDTSERGPQCGDGVDNDGDGQLDCADESCEGADGCGAVGAACDETTCPADSVCLDAPGGQTCACAPGFAGTPGACTDVDECATGTDVCAPAATCENSVGSHRCLCNAGTSGNGIGCVANLYLDQPAVQLNELHTGCTTDFSNGARKAAEDGFNLYAAMRCGGQVVVAVSSDRGATWSEVEAPIPDAAEVAIQGGASLPVWVAAITSTGDLVATSSVDLGATWSAPEVLGSGFDPARGLAMGRTEPVIYVAAATASEVHVFARLAAGSGGSWTPATVPVAATAFDLLVDTYRYDAWLVGDDASGPFAVPALRSRTQPEDLAFGALVRPQDVHTVSDWAWGNGVVYAAGSGSTSEAFVSVYTTITAQGAPTYTLGEVPQPLPRQRVVSADQVGNLYMVSATQGSAEPDLELHFATASVPELGIARPLGAGHSPHVAALPSADGALVVYTVGTDVFAQVQTAAEPSCARYQGTRNRQSGAYVLDPDGEGGRAPFGALCDMTTDGGGWTMVHKLSSNVSASPLNAWFDMVLADDSRLFILDTGTDVFHYTNSIVFNQWNDATAYVNEARVAVYTGGVENAFLRFTVPPFSSNSAWFAQANLVASSWTDLATATPDFFALSGNGEAGHSWQITLNTDICQLASGWLVVDTGASSCTWEDKFTSDVSILYADPTGVPVAAEFDAPATRIKEADTMIVWVR